jgi:hypothetical protein
MMLPVLSAPLAFAVGLFRSRASLCLAHLALRHQWAVDQQTAHRPRFRLPDRLFWVWLSHLRSGWQATLVFVPPHTLIAWQQRFRDHWRRLSQCGTSGLDVAPGAHISDCLVPWGKDPGHGVPLPPRRPRHAGVLLWCRAVEPVQRSYITNCASGGRRFGP